jgi:uncharacterized membrane protein
MARVAYKTSSESFPRQGNRELALTLDFTNVGTINDDLSPEMQASEIETIQSLYIDNSLNAASFIIQFFPSFQTVTAQPFTQGIYPVICWGRVSYKAITNAGIKIPVIFSNTRKDYFVWGPVPGVTVVPPLTNIPLNFQPLAVGDNILIPAVALQTIKSYRMLLTFGGNSNIQFFDGPSAQNRPLTGLFPMFPGGSITLQPTGIPWFTDTVNQPFVLNSSAGVNAGGMISYVQS